MRARREGERERGPLGDQVILLHRIGGMRTGCFCRMGDDLGTKLTVFLRTAGADQPRCCVTDRMVGVFLCPSFTIPRLSIQFWLIFCPGSAMKLDLPRPIRVLHLLTALEFLDD